jgi:hypothetical protein
LRLYIHIGTAKTGTTSLQHFFESNRERLKERGLYYPRSGQLVGLGFAHYGFRASLDGPGCGIQPQFSYAEYLAQLRDEVAGCGCESVLLSDESWFEGPDAASRFVADCISAFSVVTLIVYLRRNDCFVESFYKHHLKELALTTGIDEAYYLGKPLFCRYDMSLQRFPSLVPRDHLIVRCYEWQQLNTDFRRHVPA